MLFCSPRREREGDDSERNERERKQSCFCQRRRDLKLLTRKREERRRSYNSRNRDRPRGWFSIIILPPKMDSSHLSHQHHHHHIHQHQAAQAMNATTLMSSPLTGALPASPASSLVVPGAVTSGPSSHPLPSRQMPIFVTDMHPLLFHPNAAPSVSLSGTGVASCQGMASSNAHNNPLHFQALHHHHNNPVSVATTVPSLSGASAAAAAVVAAAAASAHHPNALQSASFPPNLSNNSQHHHHHHHVNSNVNNQNNHNLPHPGMHPHHRRTWLLQQQNMEAQRQMYEQHLQRYVSW